MKLLRRSIIALILGALTHAALAADWPTFHADNGRNPRSAESLNAPHLIEDWKFTASQPPAPAWPAPARWDAFSLVKNMRSMRNYDAAFHIIAAANHIYFGSSADDSVYCLDAATGKIKWTFTADGPVRAAPSFHDGKLYFGSDDGHAYCLDASTGKFIWRTRAAPQFKPIFNDGRAISLWPVRTGVLIENGLAYFGGSLLPWEESYLCAVDAKTGDLGDGEKSSGRYRRALGKNLTLEGTLLSTSDQLIAPQGRVAPLLFSKATGEPRGSLEGGGGCFVVVTPDAKILHGPGNKEGWITESDIASRKKIASFNAGSAIIVDGDFSYLLATDMTLTAVDRKQRSQVWQTSCNGTLAMILAGSHLFIGGEDKVLAYDKATGDLLWTAPVQGRAISLAAANGALLVSTDEGVIHCLRAGEKPAPGAVDVKKQRAIEEAIKPPVLPVAPVKDDALIGRWIFQRDQVKDATIKELTTGGLAKITGKTRLIAADKQPAMRFDGGAEIIISEGNRPVRLPEKELTAEAWVNIEQAMEWGGIISYMQDNGDYEQGWILGYQKDKFSLGVAAKTKNKFTYMPGKTSFNPRGWHHVVGTYDGVTMRLYVDGKLDAESKEQSGPIAYPPNGWHVIGAYHDKDENYKLKGALHEVRLYQRVLTPAEIEANYKLRAGLFPTLPELPPAPPKALIAMGPWLEFTSPGEAVVRWHTSKPTATRLTFNDADAPPREHVDTSAKIEHEVILKDLRRDRACTFRIQTLIDGTPGIAGVSEFDCDTHMNYTQPAIAENAAGLSGDAAIAERAARIIKSSAIDRGIALVIGLGDGGKLAWELARQSGLRVIAFDTDRAKVDAARAALREAGVYGQRVAALHVDSYDNLPLRRDGANLIIINGAAADEAALKPYLRPDGGTLWRDGREPMRRGPLDGTGSWTHMYGSANNAGFAGETLAGATATTQLEAQWVGRPGPRGNPDRQPRKPAPLAAAGRLFVQGHQRVTALDAYNGSILWHWEIPPMVRFNVPRDASNWCADDRHVFIAIDDRVWKLDAATGRIVSRAEALNESTPLKHADWGYVARVNDLLIGSAVPRGSNYTNLFGGDAWYDEPGGPKAAKSCSDSLFALDAATGIKRWVHAGLIINPTITIEDGRATFLESRSAKLKAAPERHISSDDLWKDLHLVTLDLSTGQVLWEKKLDIQPGSASIQLASSQGRLVLMSSHAKKYHLYTFAAKDGAPLWSASAPWFDGKDDNPHHGTHMSRPVIVDQKLFIRPWIFDVATGAKAATRMPVIKEGHGCGTYCATQNVLIFRSGDISVWDQNAGTKTSWNRLRPDCWLSTIPALGMVLSPEGGGGCSCGSWMETSIGFMPVPASERKVTQPGEKVEPGAAPIQR